MSLPPNTAPLLRLLPLPGRQNSRMEPGNPNQLLLRIFLPGPPIANQSSGQSPIDHTRCRVKEDKGIQGLRTEIAWSDEQPSASQGGCCCHKG